MSIVKNLLAVAEPGKVGTLSAAQTKVREGLMAAGIVNGAYVVERLLAKAGVADIPPGGFSIGEVDAMLRKTEMAPLERMELKSMLRVAGLIRR